MKTIGIIGGLGPEATSDYYKGLIRQVDALKGDQDLSYPEIIIYSVNMARFVGMLDKGDKDGAADYIAGAINKLAAAGADFAAISANTPHLLIKEISSKADIPLISIVETCRERARQMHLVRCGLLGTGFTMKSDFYREAFATYNIEIAVPGIDEIEIINRLIFNELEKGIFKDETRASLLGIVNRMIDNYHIDSLILGCTEFPLLFTDSGYLGIPFLNTSQIHIEEIVKRCME